MKLLLTALAATAAFANAYTEEALADQITSPLPGMTEMPGFNHFSGYIQVSDSGRKIFYWYFESTRDPANDPVVLWTNGGPGCSGFLGLFTEQGPFKPQADGTLTMNEYSWNGVANMLFVEQPAGVGFSYAEDGDYHTGDDQAAVDNYQLILNFLQRYPEVQNNPFYITSESYGGHYMPELAKEIVTSNVDGAINFKGFAVGNPYTDAFTNRIAQYQAYYSHGTLPGPLYDRWASKCSRHSIRNFVNCTYLEAGMMEIMGKGINPYALDYPVCTEKSASSQSMKLMNLMHSDTRETLELLQSSDDYQPCAENYLIAYLNRDDVKEAIHAKSDVTWASCASPATLKYDIADRERKMQGYYNELIDGGYGLHILVYSGDDDSVCATSGTQDWLWKLGYDVEPGKYWRTWEVDGQTAGYVTHFKDSVLTFATVHGAGHEVPTYKPKAALVLFENFLNGVW